MRKIFKLVTIFFVAYIFYSFIIDFRNKSLYLMPEEYKLVQKIFNKISLNNDLGNRPVTIKIRAGDDMHYLSKDLGLCKDKDNYCSYFVNLNPFKKYKGYRADEINNAIKHSYLEGHIGAGASSNGNIFLDRSTFKVLENKDSYLASAIAHEMMHILQFSPFEASRETLKDTKNNQTLTNKEIDKTFKKKVQLMETQADLGGALMLFYADYPKETYLNAMEFVYKQAGIIHDKSQYSKHPDFFTRINLIKAFMKDESFSKEEINNPAAPLKWKYNRKENWIKFYPNKIKK